ncbi:MAG TPA: DpnD/PcfM family protein [Chitinophagales bacterium]|nr:DpnD/PcfM family protein [Chitinophagales bacterium]
MIHILTEEKFLDDYAAGLGKIVFSTGIIDADKFHYRPFDEVVIFDKESYLFFYYRNEEITVTLHDHDCEIIAAKRVVNNDFDVLFNIAMSHIRTIYNVVTTLIDFFESEYKFMAILNNGYRFQFPVLLTEFDIVVTETLSKTVTVKALNSDAALDMVQEMYENEKIILDASHYQEVFYSYSPKPVF